MFLLSLEEELDAARGSEAKLMRLLKRIYSIRVFNPACGSGITRGLRAMIRRRSAIEPAIGHMKADGKLDRNWHWGSLGDAIHAVLCGAGHNLRKILRKLRLFYVLILVAMLSFQTAAPLAA